MTVSLESATNPGALEVVPKSEHRFLDANPVEILPVSSAAGGTSRVRRALVVVGSLLGCALVAVLLLSSGSSTSGTSVPHHRLLSEVHKSSSSPPHARRADETVRLASAASTTSAADTGKQKRLPQCIIIGARKCGTRALLEFMNLHPQVAIATEEIHFFDDDSRYSRGVDWYRSRMPESTPDQITVEKSPRYFIDELTPARIHDMNSSIKLILILRDPVTRTVSDFAQILANRRKRGKHVKRFGRLVIDPDTKEINTDLRMVTTSMYVRHLTNWYRYFRRPQLHIVNGDELVRDPYSELKRVEKFLGLRPFLRRDHFVFNATKGFYCARKDTGTLCLNKGKGRPHPNVSKRILRKLRRFFRRSNEKLFALTGQQFPWEKL